MIPFKKVPLTSEQERAIEIARVALMASCPFYAHYFYAEMEEYPTPDVPTAATDGRRIFYNPAYLMSLSTPERVFVFAHEIDHVICRHPQRFKTYAQAGELRGLPFNHEFMNVCADYVINAGLIETGVGMMNPDWLFAQDVPASDLAEDVYVRKFPKKPPPPDGSGGGQGSRGGSTYGKRQGAAKTLRKDPQAAAQGGSFDQVLEPQRDPVTGREDIPDEAEFREAVARAAAAAKAMGKLPARLQRIVEEILDPQVDWREHLRMLVTGKIGSRRETWERPNRRRLVLNPIIILPGRAGHGAGTVVVAVDTSGSIGEKELAAFMAETGGVLADVHPQRIVVIGCDAAVSQVEEVTSLDDVQDLRARGLGGGGGTSFIPVFDYVAEHDLKPDAMIYCTDMYGSFPDEKPPYDVIWAATTDVAAPWGDVVRIKL